jgi:hypothetical protein
VLCTCEPEVGNRVGLDVSPKQPPLAASALHRGQLAAVL